MRNLRYVVLTTVTSLQVEQPRSQGLSSYRPLERGGGKMREPGNEVAS